MIETVLVEKLSSLASVYCGGLPLGASLPAISYQVFARTELQHQGGLSGSTKTSFRITVHGTYSESKALVIEVKKTLQSSGLKWSHDGEWDINQPSGDSQEEFFHGVAMNISIWSNETQE